MATTLAPHTQFTIVTAVKNRSHPLRYTLPTWLVQPNLQQLILVDWGSDVPLIDELDSLKFPHWPNKLVTIIRVEDRPYWQLAQAINFGMRFAKYPRTLKLDADVVMTESLLDRIPINKNTFVSGQSLPRDLFNGKPLCGTCCFNTADFHAIKGYDERIKSYGYEDIDMYKRLTSLGRLHQSFKPSQFLHLHHSESIRQTHQEVKCSTVKDALKLSRATAAGFSVPWVEVATKPDFKVTESPDRPGYFIARQEVN